MIIALNISLFFKADPEAMLSGTDDNQLAGCTQEDFTPEKEAELLASDKEDTEDMDVEPKDDDFQPAAASESFCCAISSVRDPTSPRLRQPPLLRTHNAILVARLALMSSRSSTPASPRRCSRLAHWLRRAMTAQPLLHDPQLCHKPEHLLLLRHRLSHLPDLQLQAGAQGSVRVQGSRSLQVQLPGCLRVSRSVLPCLLSYWW